MAHANLPQTEELRPLDLAYIAGFFDGEGSVTIHENCKPSPRGISPNHTLQVSLGNTDPRVLEWIKSLFGGGISYRRVEKANHRHVAQWTLRAASALPFLVAIRPYLRMKGEQVDVAIEYQRTKALKGPWRVTAETVAWRESKRQEIRRLNARAWIA